MDTQLAIGAAADAAMANANTRTLLLLTRDEQLAYLVAPLLDPIWTLARYDGRYTAPEIFAHPNIRIVVLDDEGIAEADRGWLLNRILKGTRGAALIYVANDHSDAIEKLARGGGAHYYLSKPLSPQLFGYVLRSFIRNHR